jgi:hypothetical protein
MIEREPQARAARVPIEAITTFILGGMIMAALGVAVAAGYLPLPTL